MKPLRARLPSCPGLSLLGIVTLSASAQQSTQVLQSYDVELLVFRTLNPNASPEEWSMEAAEAGQRLAIPEDEPEPSAASAPPPPTTSIPRCSRRAGSSSPVSTTPCAAAATISRWRISACNAAGLCTQRREAPDDQLDGAGEPGIVGQVALTRGRYLHLTLDLVYDAPGAAGEPTQRFVMRQSRRMRSNERHYLDSPRFGVVALVTPSNPSG